MATCVRGNPYTCPPVPHQHDPAHLLASLTKDTKAFEWEMNRLMLTRNGMPYDGVHEAPGAEL